MKNFKYFIALSSCDIPTIIREDIHLSYLYGQQLTHEHMYTSYSDAMVSLYEFLQAAVNRAEIIHSNAMQECSPYGAHPNKDAYYHKLALNAVILKHNEAARHSLSMLKNQLTVARSGPIYELLWLRPAMSLYWVLSYQIPLYRGELLGVMLSTNLLLPL